MQRKSIKLRKFRVVCCTIFYTFFCSVIVHSGCYSYSIVPDTVGDAGTISAISSSTPATPPTASLTLSSSSMTSSAVTPGSTATTSTNVTVNVSNAASYSLTLKFNKTTLTGTTTINAGNATTDNTWGYKWDNAANYSTPSTTGSTLTVPALSNDSASFTKTLAFAAKFASNAEAGHYTNTGTLSLVASPKEAVVTLANLTQMQQLAEGYAPDACKNTTIPSGKDYAGPYTLTDVRDNNTYTVYKFKDNKCWMTQNLRLSSDAASYSAGRYLVSTTSDLTSYSWVLSPSSTSGFNDDTASNMYYNPSTNTGYYTWCAATAGTCTNATTSNQEASSSICPKGWKLPTGGSGGEFQELTTTIGATNNATGSTKIRSAPYSFAYTGYMYNGSLSNVSTSGHWWSRTANSSTNAYYLGISDSSISVTGSIRNRYYGRAIRCVAQ